MSTRRTQTIVLLSDRKSDKRKNQQDSSDRFPHQEGRSFLPLICRTQPNAQADDACPEFDRILNPTSGSERAVSGRRNIYPARLACGNELDSHVLSHNITFVPNDVNVCAAVIDECHSRGIHVGRACWIVAFIIRQLSGRDDNQTVATV